MMNYYDKNEFDISSLGDEYKGIALAKRYLFSAKIAILYVVAFLFVCFFYVKPKLWVAIDSDKYFYFFSGAAAIFLYIAILYLIGLIIRISIVKLDIQEKIYYDLYLYYKVGTKLKGLGSAIILAMARLEAIKGDKEMCRNALSLSHTRLRKNKDYQTFQKWIDSEEADFDESTVTKPNPKLQILCAIEFLVVAIGCFLHGFNKEVLVAYGVPEALLAIISLLFAVAMALLYTFLLATIITRRQERSFKILITSIIFVITCIISGLLYVAELRNSIFPSEEEEPAYAGDEYAYYGDYDYSYDEDEYDYSIDASSEPLNDLDIMNQMIALAYYLLEEGTIDNFTNVSLSYTAKGVVRGTIDYDDNYEYNLYDNGVKEDENGNQCVELVLEAEPLDENGNSLGQTEAVLKGFYLVNLETSEVIDEHKTHW